MPGFFLLTGGLGIALALAGDTLVFLWLLSGVPDNPFGFRALLPGAVFGAVGLEALKLVGAWYLSLIGSNVTAQALGGIVGLIVWINVVARFAFYTACWAATMPAIERVRAPASAPGTPPVTAAPDPVLPHRAPAPLPTALALLGIGALAGVVGSHWLRPLRHRRAVRPTGPADEAAAGS